MKRPLLALFLLLVSPFAFAQSTLTLTCTGTSPGTLTCTGTLPGTQITALPAAIAFSGPEQFVGVQSGAGVSTTATQFSNFTLNNLTFAKIFSFWSGCNSGTPVLLYNQTCSAGGGGGGGVSSVGMTVPSYFSVSPAAITSSGVFGITQNAPFPATAGGTGNNNAFGISVGGGSFATIGGAITLAAAGTVSDTLPPGTSNLGYLGLPNSNGGPYTTSHSVVAVDGGTKIPMFCGSACNVTLPANSVVPLGSDFCTEIVALPGTAVVTLAITTDTMTFFPSLLTGSRTLVAGSSAVVCKYDSTHWANWGVGES